MLLLFKPKAARRTRGATDSEQLKIFQFIAQYMRRNQGRGRRFLTRVGGGSAIKHRIKAQVKSVS